MGCTEPIAVAYCAALARKTLGAMPERVCIEASANIIKNVKSVVVPHTGGKRGHCGRRCGRHHRRPASAGLQVLSQVTEDQVRAIDDFLEKGEFHVERSGKDYVFHIRVVLFAGADTASAEIAGFHTNVIQVERNGVIVHHRDYSEAAIRHERRTEPAQRGAHCGVCQHGENRGRGRDPAAADRLRVGHCPGGASGGIIWGQYWQDPSAILRNVRPTTGQRPTLPLGLMPG